MALIWKRGYFWPTFHIFLFTRENLHKFLQHISHSHTYMYFAHPFDLFSLPILKKYEFIRYSFSLVWVLVLILIRAILEQSINNKMVSKTYVGMSTTDMCIYTNAKFIVICKPRTLNDGGARWRLSSVQKSQKALLLSSSHFAFFIGKIIITW